MAPRRPTKVSRERSRQIKNRRPAGGRHRKIVKVPARRRYSSEPRRQSVTMDGQNRRPMGRKKVTNKPSQEGRRHNRTSKAIRKGGKISMPHRNPYMNFVHHHREQVMRSLPQNTNPITDTAKRLGKIWRQMSSVEKTWYTR